MATNRPPENPFTNWDDAVKSLEDSVEEYKKEISSYKNDELVTADRSSSLQKKITVIKAKALAAYEASKKCVGQDEARASIRGKFFYPIDRIDLTNLIEFNDFEKASQLFSSTITSYKAQVIKSYKNRYGKESGDAAPPVNPAKSPLIVAQTATPSTATQPLEYKVSEESVPCSTVQADRAARKESPDFCKKVTVDGKYEYGVGEVQGKRDSQEDQIRVKMKEVALCSQLSHAEIMAALRETCCLVAELCQDEKSGSTLCCSTAWRDEKNQLHSIVANIGDSTAFMVELNKEAKAELLHELHNASNEKERKRIREEDGFLHQGYLHGSKASLAVTRDLGSSGFYDDDQVLCSDADVVDAPIRTLPPDHQPYLVTACDGLTEKKVVTKEDIAQITKENRQQGPGVTTAKLIEAASIGGSTDNISVAVVPIPPGNIPVSTLVVDGHNGRAAAKKAADAFYVIFEQQLQNQLALKQGSPNAKALPLRPSLAEKTAIAKRKAKERNIKECMEQCDTHLSNIFDYISDHRVVSVPQCFELWTKTIEERKDSLDLSRLTAMNNDLIELKQKFDTKTSTEDMRKEIKSLRKKYENKYVSSSPATAPAASLPITSSIFVHISKQVKELEATTSKDLQETKRLIAGSAEQQVQAAKLYDKLHHDIHRALIRFSKPDDKKQLEIIKTTIESAFKNAKGEAACLSKDDASVNNAFTIVANHFSTRNDPDAALPPRLE